MRRLREFVRAATWRVPATPVRVGPVLAGLALAACGPSPTRNEVRGPPWPETLWVRDQGFPDGYDWGDPRALPAGAVLARIGQGGSFDEDEWIYELEPDPSAAARGNAGDSRDAASPNLQLYRVSGRQRCIDETWWAEARRVPTGDGARGR